MALPRIYAVVMLNKPDSMDSIPMYCIAGIPDHDRAVKTINDWITRTVREHNADPNNKADPRKYYADLIGESEDAEDNPGYIFYLENGRREDVVKFIITNGAVYDRDKFLPNISQLV